MELKTTKTKTVQLESIIDNLLTLVVEIRASNADLAQRVVWDQANKMVRFGPFENTQAGEHIVVINLIDDTDTKSVVVELKILPKEDSTTDE